MVGWIWRSRYRWLPVLSVSSIKRDNPYDLFISTLELLVWVYFSSSDIKDCAPYVIVQVRSSSNKTEMIIPHWNGFILRLSDSFRWSIFHSLTRVLMFPPSEQGSLLLIRGRSIFSWRSDWGSLSSFWSTHPCLLEEHVLHVAPMVWLSRGVFDRIISLWRNKSRNELWI